MSVVAETAVAYRGGGRRWFTLRAACKAEAKVLVGNKYGCPGEDLPQYVDRLYRIRNRYARLLERRARRNPHDHQ